MPYKDKDKQKEANRQWVRQKRADKQGTTEDVVLHPAIIQTIDRMSIRQDGTLDKQEQLRRTGIAYAYEALYPGRPYTGAGL